MISVPVVLYMVDLVLRGWFMSMSKCKVVSSSVLGSKYVRLELVSNIHFLAGQYVYLYLPGVSRTQLHPFSITNSPTGEPTQRVSILVNVNGDWTGRMMRHCKSGRLQEEDVWLDGGYGRLCFARPEQFRSVMYIAGGAGVSPLLSLLEDMNRSNYWRGCRIKFIWTAREVDLFQGFSFELLSLLRVFGDSISMTLCLTAKEVHPGSLESPLDGQLVQRMIRTRPDFHDLFNNVRLECHQHAIDQVGVYVCGPSGLHSSVLKETSKVGDQISFRTHTEPFAL